MSEIQTLNSYSLLRTPTTSTADRGRRLRWNKGGDLRWSEGHQLHRTDAIDDRGRGACRGEDRQSRSRHAQRQSS
jgi:hypothetical protein